MPRPALYGTDPYVFIIESQGLKDENEDYYGKTLNNYFRLLQKKTKYCTIKTQRELVNKLKTFGKSRCRYLIICCHGRPGFLQLTSGEEVAIGPFADLTAGFFNNKRIFFSACELGSEEFVKLLRDKNPNMASFTAFTAATTENMQADLQKLIPFWTTFFYLVDKESRRGLKPEALKKSLDQCADIFDLRIIHYTENEWPPINLPSLR